MLKLSEIEEELELTHWAKVSRLSQKKQNELNRSFNIIMLQSLKELINECWIREFNAIWWIMKKRASKQKNSIAE